MITTMQSSKDAVENYVTLPVTLRAGMSKPGALRFVCMPALMAAKRTSTRLSWRLRSGPLHWQTGLLMSNCEF